MSVRFVVLHTQEIRGQRSTATARKAGIAGPYVGVLQLVRHDRFKSSEVPGGKFGWPPVGAKEP